MKTDEHEWGNWNDIPKHERDEIVRKHHEGGIPTPERVSHNGVSYPFPDEHKD